jgi:hypothetical protein
MKSKIGIFGDSYANPNSTRLVLSTSGKNHINPICWPALLADDYNLDVENHAKVCTSIFYSYKKFCDHKDKYDIIIFVVTENSRLYTSNQNILISNISTIERQLKKYPDHNIFTYNQYLAAKNYYEYLLEPEFTGYVRNKIVEDVVNICNNENKKLILIPAFEEDIKEVKYFNCTLREITTKELITQFGSMDYVMENTKNRACHMSKSNNKILARLLVDIINGKELVVTLDDFEFTKVNDPENYWILE